VTLMATNDEPIDKRDGPNRKLAAATKGRGLAVIGIAAPAIIVLIALAVSGVTGARNAAYRNRCTCHGKQLGIALLNYHDVNKSFPPAFVADAEGRPTNYVAIVGPETAWPVEKSTTIKAISDGTSKTIMLVEVADSGINWLEPRDLPFEQALRGINPPGIKPAISSLHAGGALAIFADAHVNFLRDDVPTDILRALLTAAGNDIVPIPDN
jgi:uncharacterized protein DUF1559